MSKVVLILAICFIAFVAANECPKMADALHKKKNGLLRTAFNEETRAVYKGELATLEKEYNSKCVCPPMADALHKKKNGLLRTAFNEETRAVYKGELATLEKEYESKCACPKMDEAIKAKKREQLTSGSNERTREAFKVELAKLEKEYGSKCAPVDCPKLQDTLNTKRRERLTSAFNEINLPIFEAELANLEKEYASKCGKIKLEEEEEVSPCVVSGCNGEICASEPQISICLDPAQPTCYRFAKCHHHKGECKWKNTFKSYACKATEKLKNLKNFF